MNEIDLCEQCVCRGNYEKCMATKCPQHESWIAKKHEERLSLVCDILLQYVDIEAIPDTVWSYIKLHQGGIPPNNEDGYYKILHK